MNEGTATVEAPAQPVAQAPAQPENVTPAAPAEAQAPAAVPAAPAQPALTPEQQAMAKAREGQIALQMLRKNKEDACAAEIETILAKHGCELIVGHSVKVSFKQ